MGYKDFGRLKYFVKGVPDIKIDHDGVCKGCALQKNVKIRCTSSVSRSNGILYLIYFDVCGPMPNKNLGRFLYYVTFIHDYSHKSQIYVLKANDQVF